VSNHQMALQTRQKAPAAIGRTYVSVVVSEKVFVLYMFVGDQFLLGSCGGRVAELFDKGGSPFQLVKSMFY